MIPKLALAFPSRAIPNGLPSDMTNWPRRGLKFWAMRIGFNFASIFRTAKSVHGSAATIDSTFSTSRTLNGTPDIQT